MRRRYISILLCLLIGLSTNSYAQDDTKFKAATYFKYKDYNRALKMYLEMYKEDSTNVETNLNIGICYINVNDDRSQAIPYLKSVYDKGEYEDELVLHLGKAYMYAYEFDEAISYFNIYKKSKNQAKQDVAEFFLRNCENSKALIKSPLDITFENLGPIINTKYPEYYPFITKNTDPNIDAEVLYFTSSREKNVRKRKSSFGYFTSDIYYSDLTDTSWSKAATIGNVVNTMEDEQCVYVTPDGKDMILSLDTEISFGDIFHTAPVRKGIFSKLIMYDKPINTKRTELEGCITMDGNMMIVSRKTRKGGFGETDLYMHKKLNDGTWGPGVNLGSNINTEFKEAFPMFDEKTGTLYFSSEGHLNMGGFDIFKAKYDSTENTFGQAENIGYPINTPEDNLQISLSEDGKSAYVSAYRKEGLGDLDIYKITFNEYKPKEVIVTERKDSIVYIYVEKIVYKDKEEDQNTSDPKNTGKGNKDNATEISDESGLVYRVQIGVYLNPISSGKVFKGIQSISKKSAESGVKYFSGSFSTFGNAQDGKENINELGITDAFIVAYFDGKRISIQAALAYENKE